MKTKTFFLVLALQLILGAQMINAQANNTMNISDKNAALATIAALEAKGDISSLGQAINVGFDSGLTVSEIKEALSQLYAYTGFPRSLNALGALQQAINSRQAAGLHTEQGTEADPLPADYDALKQGTDVQTRLSGKPFNYEFAPQTDFYLKAHLFGDIFARNNLSFATREIVTVSAISALKGCEPQLRAHVAGARNMGVSDDEIRALPAVLEKNVGPEEAFRLRQAIAAVFNEPFTEGAPVEGQVFPKGEPNTAYAKYFIGNSYLAQLANGEGKLGVANVTFEPRCRNNWHIHHRGGQILICVGGRGWYQEWGKPARELHPGDVVDIPAEAKHWHGAARDSWFQHIAIGVPAEGATTTWLEPVIEEEYDKLP
ncbi:MAG: carboxymuconolactone decarboxylase family protein [Muribaculaceae bacterium]|nr:carboxymuconolactone decarboxylase family protein [Muribaculaceae bacterium]